MLALALAIAMQAVDRQSANPRPAFEVASVKPDKSPGRPISDFPIGPGRVYIPREGIFRATHLLLIQYITFAYNLTHSQMTYLARHVPNWVTTEEFDIRASVEGKPTENQLRLMMQSLLEDRFKLSIQKQSREMPVFAVVLEKPGTPGPRLVSHSPDPPCPKMAPPAEAFETVSGGFPLACHGIVVLPPNVAGQIRFGARDVTLSDIIDALSGSILTSVDRPLVDRTGLTGTFDFVLECEFEPVGAPPSAADSSPSEPLGPTLRGALQEQLGLKLEPQRDTVEIFVIDHVEQPTAD